MTMFQGISGKTSIMRVLTAVVVLGVLGVWVISNICCWCSGCQMVDITVQEVSLILGALACKAGQRVAENGKRNGNGVQTTNDIPIDKKE